MLHVNSKHKPARAEPLMKRMLLLQAGADALRGLLDVPGIELRRRWSKKASLNEVVILPGGLPLDIVSLGCTAGCRCLLDHKHNAFPAVRGVFSASPKP